MMILKVKFFEHLCAPHWLSSYSSIPVQEVCGGHQLEGSGDVLTAAVEVLATGDVIGDFLGLWLED